MSDHIVRAYDSELHALDRRIAEMGGLVEQGLAQAFEALERRDTERAQRVIDGDRRIDAIEGEVEELVVQIIARRQPMANDLRQIMAGMRVAGDLERIGDLAKNIAKRVLAIAGESYPSPLVTGLKHMVELALIQLKDVLDAYARRDDELALSVWRKDQDLDALYNSMFRELLTYMMEDPRNIGICTHLLFGAKNIERIGDHTTNMAEIVHFLVRGQPLVDDRPKRDTTSMTLVSPADKS